MKFSFIDKYILENFGIEAFKPWSDIDRPFNENEIKNLARNPNIFFGNHTHNHAILTNYNKEEIKEELRECNKALLNLTGRFPSAVAFPNGNYNKLVLQTIEKEGFRSAFSTDSKRNHLSINKKDKLVCFNKYNTNTENIKRLAGFWRLGYDPDLLYNDLKTIMKSKIKRNGIQGKV